MRAEGDAQKKVVESIKPGEVLIMEARGDIERGHDRRHPGGAGRWRRGGAGIVTDGGVRDTPGVSELDIATYYRAANAASLWHRHVPLDIDVPITCAGVLVMPGDVIVGDAEGVLVIPAALADEVAQRRARGQEEREAFALERVKAGESIRGIYPLSDDRRDDYERWRRNRDQESS